MKRVVVLGRGGAGKSTVSRQLGAAAGLPVLELDKHFWSADLTPLTAAEWVAVQERLIAGEGWVLDGDLGSYDVLSARVRAADTVVVLDFPLWLCAWRAIRRSRENLAFWRWVIGYRRHSLPVVMATVAEHAPGARVWVLRHPREVDRVLSAAVS